MWFATQAQPQMSSCVPSNVQEQPCLHPLCPSLPRILLPSQPLSGSHPCVLPPLVLRPPTTRCLVRRRDRPARQRQASREFSNHLCFLGFIGAVWMRRDFRLEPWLRYSWRDKGVLGSALSFSLAQGEAGPGATRLNETLRVVMHGVLSSHLPHGHPQDLWGSCMYISEPIGHVLGAAWPLVRSLHLSNRTNTCIMVCLGVCSLVGCPTARLLDASGLI